MTLPLFKPKPNLLRWYQQEALEEVHEKLRKDRSTMVVMATGLGKTVLIGALVRDWVNANGRVLVMAHRNELVEQLHAEVLRSTGLDAYIEKGPSVAPPHARIVVASVQSLSQRRLERFAPNFFSHIVADEVHHYTAETYRRPIKYFANAKLLGVTATPDRADEVALGTIIDDVAYVMDIWDGIEHGYLVPVEGRVVEIDDIHLENVHVVAGKLQDAELDMAMLLGIEGVIKKVRELEPNRQGIGFFPGVASANAAATRMNELLGKEAAVVVSGSTPPEERADMVRKFRGYVYQYLFNCNVATEGFDAPCADLIIQARPTLSRGLYTQMVGRGTRPIPGTVDQFREQSQAVERREAIARSQKPNMMILDFVGNSTRHELRLASVEDMLGGNFDEPTVKKAREIRKEKEAVGEYVSPMEALRLARERMRELFSSVKSRVEARVMPFDPFRMLDIEHNDSYDMRFGRTPATDGQRSVLLRAGIDAKTVSELSKRQASRLINEVVARRTAGLATFKQLKALEKYGFSDKRVSFKAATAALGYAKGRRKFAIDTQYMSALLELEE